ncbi:unnamed protein product [marine sediment metagenome]|uniref:Uncharacterized protein n=1 Tax=marine sediment metagenome TaxID=412755 RepID=X0S928_9ZZZZ
MNHVLNPPLFQGFANHVLLVQKTGKHVQQIMPASVRYVTAQEFQLPFQYLSQGITQIPCHTQIVAHNFGVQILKQVDNRISPRPQFTSHIEIERRNQRPFEHLGLPAQRFILRSVCDKCHLGVVCHTSRGSVSMTIILTTRTVDIASYNDFRLRGIGFSS